MSTPDPTNMILLAHMQKKATLDLRWYFRPFFSFSKNGQSSHYDWTWLLLRCVPVLHVYALYVCMAEIKFRLWKMSPTERGFWCGVYTVYTVVDFGVCVADSDKIQTLQMSTTAWLLVRMCTIHVDFCGCLEHRFLYSGYCGWLGIRRKRSAHPRVMTGKQSKSVTMCWDQLLSRPRRERSSSFSSGDVVSSPPLKISYERKPASQC